MKLILIFLSLLEIQKVILFTPIWNLKTTADDLLLNKDSTTILLSEGGWKSVVDGNTFLLEKHISRKDNKLTQKNYYKIDNFAKQETSWEDIESFYQIKAYFICPKGSYYLTQYIDGTLYERKPFDISGKWELLCYRQVLIQNVMFTFYFNSELTKIYYYKYWDKFGDGIEINRRLLDLVWTTGSKGTHEYPMIALTLKDNKIYISKIAIYEKDGKICAKDIKHRELNDNLLNSEAQFFNSRIFYISYDDTNFISGFSENAIKNGVFGDISEYIITNNVISPFEYFEDIKINYIKFIRNTKYVYYNIITKSTNQNYIGVIDIQFNRIIYNVENIFKEIKPYSNSGLFLVTDNTIYRECFSGKDEKNNCYVECPSGQILVLDTINSNYCVEESSDDYYILKPDNIPIANCDESFYVIQNKNECGLCKDLNINKQYKIINEKECIEKPENTYYINEQLKILNYCNETCKTCIGEKETDCTSCYTGYKLVNGKCLKMECFPSCKECYEESDNETNQHCLTCQTNKLFQEDNDNCIDKCEDGYYEENITCKKCHESCLKCEKSGTDENPNCLLCANDKYLLNDSLKCSENCGINYYKNESEKKCYRCSVNCETCSRSSLDGNNFCLTCDKNSKFKYLLNLNNISNCVEECPNTTYLNETINKCIEIEVNETDERDETSESTEIDHNNNNHKNDNIINNNNKKNLIIIIIIPIIVFIIIIIIIIFVIYVRNKKKKIGSQLIDKINNELKDNNVLY